MILDHYQLIPCGRYSFKNKEPSFSERIVFTSHILNYSIMDVAKKKKRESVGIFPKSGTPPPPPPCLVFFPDFTVYFWEVSHVKKSKKWKWDSGRPPPLFFSSSKFPHFPVFFWQRPLAMFYTKLFVRNAK